MRICIAGLTRTGLALGLVLRGFGDHSVVVWQPRRYRDSEKPNLFVSQHPIAQPDRAVAELLEQVGPLPITNDPAMAVKTGGDLLILTAPTNECVDHIHRIAQGGFGWYGPIVAVHPGVAVLQTLHPHWHRIGYAPIQYRRDPVDRLLKLPRINLVTCGDRGVVEAVKNAWTGVDNKIPIVATVQHPGLAHTHMRA